MNSSGFWQKCSRRLRVQRPASWVQRSGLLAGTRIGAGLLALILVLPFPVPATAQTISCGSYAVAVAPQPAGHPLSDFTIRFVDSRGEIANVPFDQPHIVTPSPRNQIALLRSLGGAFALLDVGKNAITPIQIPFDRQMTIDIDSSTIQNAPDADFMLLGDIPTSIWLVDLRNGEAIDLATLLPDGSAIESASIAPDGAWVEFFGKGTASVISLENRTPPVQVATEPILPYPGFSHDGSELLYATTSATGVEIWSFDLATGIRESLGSSPSVQQLNTADGSNLLLIGDQSLSMLPAGTSHPKLIAQEHGLLHKLFTDTSVQHLLIGEEQSGIVHWRWFDISAETSKELVELTDMNPLRIVNSPNSLVFSPTNNANLGTPGTPYMILDLTTGTVSTVLTQDSSEVWTLTPAGDDAGRYALVNAVSPGSGRMWLIDTQTGNANQIGMSSGNILASVSPDGCQLATDIFDTIGEGRTSVVTVTSLVDGSTITTLPDSLLLGWAEIQTTT